MFKSYNLIKIMIGKVLFLVVPCFNFHLPTTLPLLLPLIGETLCHATLSKLGRKGVHCNKRMMGEPSEKGSKEGGQL